jgi:hypothetical protein
MTNFMKIKALICSPSKSFSNYESSVKLLFSFLLLLAPVLLHAQFAYTTNGDNTLTITAYSGTSGFVNIPTNINGLTVTSVGDWAFGVNTNLTNVTIPPTVTSIGPDAFASCISLTSVTIPSNVVSLGGSAFSDCWGLTNAMIYGITSLEDETFDDCPSLEIVTLPGTITYIHGNPFVNCPNLTEVFFLGNFPDELSGLPDSGKVFSDNPNVTVYCLPGTSNWTFCTLATGITPVLWNPQIQTTNDNFGVQNNQFGFDITGTPAIPIVVEASTNLANPVWTRLTNVTLTNGLFHFSEPAQPNTPNRYYRIGSP